MKTVVKIGTTLLAALSLAACSPGGNSAQSSSSSAASPAKVTVNAGTTSNAQLPAAGTLVMRQLYAAPHGSDAFAAITVVLNGETVVAAKVDEFQYVAKGTDWTGVPNSSKDFGQNYPSGQVLIAKRENSAAYSAVMTKEAKATKTLAANAGAIQQFVAGKTIAEVTAAAGEAKSAKQPTDVVSGATFADTAGYLQAIADAATSGMVSVGAPVTDAPVTVGQTLAAPHGTQAFGIVTVALQGGKVVASFFDEFQYVAAKDFGAVPNSDKGFGKGVKAGTVLASKRANSAAYSAVMTKEAKATHTWQENAAAISAFANGKTVAELEAAAGELTGKTGSAITDVVSGATFSDTAGYLKAMVTAAKAAN